MKNKAYNLPIDDIMDILSNLKNEGCVYVNVTVQSDKDISIAGIEPEEKQPRNNINSSTDFSQLI